VVALFRDPDPEIRQEAVVCLWARETGERAPVYLKMLKDRDPNLRLCALSVLQRLNTGALAPEPLLDLINDPDPDVQLATLRVLWRLNPDVVSRSDLLPFLGTPHYQTVVQALTPRRRPGLRPPPNRRPGTLPARARPPGKPLTSGEAAWLVRNQHLATARLLGLRALERNGDAKAVELALPLLRDSSPAVRGRARTTLCAITAQDFPADDPAKWENWWAGNKRAFVPRPPADEP
jgi:HEAT repeat protein